MGRPRSIRRIISKPSQALEAMVEGLLKQSQRPDFKIDMDTFGRTETSARGKVQCFGCAATCTVQQVASMDLTCEVMETPEERAKALRLEREEERDFEACIDIARWSRVGDLFSFFDLSDEYYELPEKLRTPYFQLDTHNWRRRIPMVRRYIDELKALGY